jgi:hypothetical protein
LISPTDGCIFASNVNGSRNRQRKAEDMRVLTILAAASLLIVPAAVADWSDNFDSYANGSALAGQGGWAGWEGDSTLTAYVTDDQSHSAPHSAEILPTTDCVQTFTETSGEWEMIAWMYIPSGSTGEQYFIMLNQYWPDTNNWSVQILFDSDAGIVEEYYSSTTTAIVYDQWVELKLDINLETGFYDIYYNGTFLITWVWQDGSGSDAIAALDLYSNGGSTIYWDDCSLMSLGALEQSTWGNIKTIF